MARSAEFDLAIKGDISDLKKALETIPALTKSEAKKMVKELDRQIKQTQKATEKQAKAIQKASRASSKFAKEGARDVKSLSDSLGSVGEKSGDIDRGFSGIGLALRDVNPKLAEASDGLADTFAVVESLTMGFGSLNPMILAGTLAIGALTLGYQSYQAELERVKQLTLDLRDAQKQLNDSQKANRENLEDSAGKLRELRNEFALMTGNMTEFDMKLEQAGQGAFDQFRANITNQETLIKQREQELDLVKRLEASAMDLSKREVVLSDKQRERLRTLQLQTATANNNLDLTQRGLREASALANIQVAIRKDLAEQNKSLTAITKMRDEAVELAQQMVEFEAEINTESEESAKNEERRAEALERSQRAEEARIQMLREALEVSDFELEKYEVRKQLERDLFLLKSDGLEREIAKIDFKYQKEEEKLQELADKYGEHELAREMASQLAIERNEELTKLRLENEKKIRDEELKTTQALFSATSELYTSLGQMAVSFHEANKEGSREAFMINKIVSSGSVAMKTAEAVMMAQTLPPPMNAIQTAIALATGSAQMANVMSQQPSFHMGGMVPDESMARVLKGEMVLSKQAVRDLGGEQGVKSITRGQKEPSRPQRFTIDFPYKNLGRYSRAIGQKPPKQTGIRGY